MGRGAGLLRVATLVLAVAATCGCSGGDDSPAAMSVFSNETPMAATGGPPGPMPAASPMPVPTPPSPTPVQPAQPPPVAAADPVTPVEPPACESGELDRDADGTPDCDDACPDDPLKTAAGACGCGVPEPMMAGGACGATCGPGELDCGMPSDEEDEPELCSVHPIPDDLRADHKLNAVYTRYASARGVPILASDSPQEEAIRRACMMVRDLSAVPEVLDTMLEEKIGLVVMGVDETSADFPEFAAWGVPDSRARGLGGVPRGLCAEENVMCDRTRDRWRGESICLHEFSHTMHLGVYNIMDRTFDSRVSGAYRAAMSAGKFQNTYAASSAVEYFAEAAQDWYNTNLESDRADGVHNEINTREELREYDPGIYAILAEVLPDEPAYQDCYFYE